MDRADAPDELSMAQALLLSYAQDLNRICELEREKARDLARANARLQLLDALKMNFLAFISHELKTPLCAIASIDLLDGDTSVTDRDELLAIVRSGHGRLSKLVDAGIEYFHWSAASPGHEDQNVDLADVVREAIRAALFPVHSTCDSPPLFVRGSRAGLLRIATILLSNATRLASSSVSVITRRSGTHAIVAVTDDGAGFEPDIAEELFRPFTIPDINHHGSGTGLSLALARAIAQAHGGDLRAVSPGPSRGATFTVTLPVADSNGASS